MRRVLQITDKRPGGGGIRRVVEDHATVLRDLGWSIGRLVMTDRPSEDLPDMTAPIAFARPARVQAAVLAALRQAAQDADVIHLHLGLTAVTPALIRHSADLAPLVVSLHDISPFEALAGQSITERPLKRLVGLRYGPARKAVWRAVCDHATAIHAPSRYLADLAQRAGAPPAHMTILPHMVSISGTDPYPLPDCASLVVYAGLLARSKGAHLLLPALRALPEDTALAICGDGPLADRIARDIKQSGLTDRVTMTGRIEHSAVLDWMGRARVVVHPSLIPEGFGLTLLEAMMLGRPVAGFANGATAEWLTDDVTGLIARPATAKALATAVSRLLRDPALAKRLGDAGAARATALCAPHGLRAGLESLYSRVLKKSAVRA